jgi:hypothetical protein
MGVQAWKVTPEQLSAAEEMMPSLWSELPICPPSFKTGAPKLPRARCSEAPTALLGTDIVAALNARGVPIPCGRGHWHASAPILGWIKVKSPDCPAMIRAERGIGEERFQAIEHFIPQLVVV